MWFFLVLCLPLALVHSIFTWFPPSEMVSTKRALIRGLISSIPVWILSRFFGSLLPSMLGSPLFALNEWFGRILPYSLLPLVAYAFFWRLDEKMEGDKLQQRLTAFYGACLGPFGFIEMTKIELSPDLYSLIILPVILLMIAASMPALFRLWRGSWTSRRVLIGMGFAIGSMLLALSRWLLMARFWYIALAIVGGGTAFAWFRALPGLTPRTTGRPAGKVPLI
ncbi:MAG TPA: hypothetical protein VMV83_01500 [Rectinemataceae bacterium]|nr:hypothetical protein [Rectinemataceae bacterium]